MKEGDWVIYHPRVGKVERGRIKRVGEEFVWVVYHCDGHWDRYLEYEGVATRAEDLEVV